MAGSLELAIPEITSSSTSNWQTTNTTPYQTASTKADYEEEAGSYGMDEKAVTGIADALNSVAKAIDRNLQFSVDKETGRIVIKVTDGDTGEVIRVIPPNDITKMQQSFGSLVGLLYNEES